MSIDIKEQAKRELTQLSFSGDWDSNQLEEDKESLRRSYRNGDFYTSRPGEEDDDWPEFTGHSDIIKKCLRHFSPEVQSAYNISAHDEGEKSWFCIELIKKK